MNAPRTISVWPIDVMDADFVRTATNVEWEAAMAAKYGDNWQDDDDLIDPTECMTAEEYDAWAAAQDAKRPI